MLQSINPYTLTYVFIALGLGYVFYQRFISPLAKVPGPLGASLSRLWLVKHTREGRLHRELLELHAQHGPLVRIAPNELSVADLDAVRKIYGMPYSMASAGQENA